MPFASQAQRALFHAAKNNPAIRKKHGLRMDVIKRMIEEDEGGELPGRVKVSSAAKRAIGRGKR